MSSVNINDNPIRSQVGKPAADATIISSGFSSGVISYQIRTKDKQGITFTVRSDKDYSQCPMIISIKPEALSIVLPFRTEMQFRVKRAEEEWGSWIDFKTRDKRYQTPDAVSQLSVSYKDRKHIIVVNNAKSSVNYTSRGAKVYNTKKPYVSTKTVKYTSRGAIVRNSD